MHTGIKFSFIGITNFCQQRFRENSGLHIWLRKRGKIGFTEPSGFFELFFAMCDRKLDEGDVKESLVAFRMPNPIEKVTGLLKLAGCVLCQATPSREERQISCMVQ